MAPRTAVVFCWFEDGQRIAAGLRLGAPVVRPHVCVCEQRLQPARLPGLPGRLTPPNIAHGGSVVRV